MLLNLSNHPSSNWSQNQMDTAIQQYGSVEGLPFPNIGPHLSSDEVQHLAEEYEAKIRKINPAAVHVMGELTFCFALINKLKSMGIQCIASTTDRITTIDEKGNKISTFKFVRFREY